MMYPSFMDSNESSEALNFELELKIVKCGVLEISLIYLWHRNTYNLWNSLRTVDDSQIIAL